MLPPDDRTLCSVGRDRVLPADPGDVGRRVLHRRNELGMTRADLAERSGIPVEFVEYVETRPADLGASTLWRLAAALETNPRILLGAGRNHQLAGRA